MTLRTRIQELREQLEKIDAAISALEELAVQQAPTPRKGHAARCSREYARLHTRRAAMRDLVSSRGE